jgi:proteasome lid subunit RPN8/RPN11
VSGVYDPLAVEHTVVPDWDRGVLNALYELAFATPGVEVGGVLVGRDQGPGHPPRIDAVIPAMEARTSREHAVFTHDVWAYVYERMGRYYQGLEIVGWYVSRPGGLGQLTQLDQAIHQQWFRHPRQIVMVFDSGCYHGALWTWSPEGLRLVQEGRVSRRYLRSRSTAVAPTVLVTLVLLGVLFGLALFFASGQPSL